MKCDAVFLYLDANYPTAKQKELLIASKAVLMISDEKINVPDGWKCSNSLMLDDFKFWIFEVTLAHNEPELLSHHLAYVIFTSGTTSGTSRGKLVSVPHQCIVPNILDFR